MHRDPRSAYREAYIAALRRRHRPRLSWLGRRTGACRCGQPIVAATRSCARLTAALAVALSIGGDH
jgi:hypothetical protein